MKKQSVTFLASIGDTVTNRHSNEKGVVSCTSTNAAGNWYYVDTPRGNSIGWWHESDIAAQPRSLAPDSKRDDGKAKA